MEARTFHSWTYGILKSLQCKEDRLNISDSKTNEILEAKYPKQPGDKSRSKVRKNVRVVRECIKKLVSLAKANGLGVEGMPALDREELKKLDDKYRCTKQSPDDDERAEKEHGSRPALEQFVFSTVLEVMEGKTPRACGCRLLPWRHQTSYPPI